MIATVELPLEDRVVNHLTDEVLSDGGQWDMAVNLLEVRARLISHLADHHKLFLQTYGVVPQPIYPESYSSSSSSNLNKLIKLKLREHGLVLRRLSASIHETGWRDDLLMTIRAKKEELMAEIWNIMTSTLGVPPRPDSKFTWDYYDKDGKSRSWSGTPLEFYRAFSSREYPVRLVP